VLLISHTCQSRVEGQPKAFEIGRLGSVELCVLVPDRWKHYGAWREADVPQDPPFKFEIGAVRWPWTGPGQFYLHWYPGLAKLFSDWRPDIIDLWEEPWGLVSAQACQLRNRLLPTCKILSETEQNIDKRLPPPFESLRSFTLRNTDYVIGRSAEAVDVLRGKGYNGPAAVVPNAVDDNLFRPMDREKCRRELGLSRFTVGYVGRLVEEKGLADMVDALSSLPEEVELLFVGSGPMEQAIERRAAELGRSDSVRIMQSRPLESLPSIMNAIDVLALPSRTTPSWKEQYGRVIIEAHACGTPVIGSTSGAIPDVVGEGGLVVPERNPGALAEAIETLRRDPARRQAMGCAGKARVEAECTWARVAEQMASIYDTMMGELRP
jgi:glycosyltransferase involved in cell wall biosynthesis